MASLTERLPWAEGWPQVVACGDGWLSLIEEVHEQLLEICGGTYYLCQIKQKFGGLRYYIDPPWWSLSPEQVERVNQVIAEAEARSFTICEKCGQSGKLVTDRGWYRTVCPLH